jgi:hypothetical protein
MFQTPIDYSSQTLEHHNIDPAGYDIQHKGDSYLWYWIDGHKTKLVYEFTREKK